RAAPRRPATLHPLRREGGGHAGRADPGGAAPRMAGGQLQPGRRLEGHLGAGRGACRPMMLARVADSLYWIGRYIERAEHVSRLSAVMLNATLDHSQGAVQTGRIGLAALGETDSGRANETYEAAHDLALDRTDDGSVVVSLARARENARQVRDQI